MSFTLYSQGVELDLTNSYLETGWYKIIKDTTKINSQVKRTNGRDHVDNNLIISAERFRKVKMSKNKVLDLKVLEIYFDSVGTKQWEQATAENIGNQFAFIFENKLINVPVVNSKIKTGHSTVVMADLDKIQIKAIKKSIKKQIKLNTK